MNSRAQSSLGYWVPQGGSVPLAMTRTHSELCKSEQATEILGMFIKCSTACTILLIKYARSLENGTDCGRGKKGSLEE